MEYIEHLHHTDTQRETEYKHVRFSWTAWLIDCLLSNKKKLAFWIMNEIPIYVVHTHNLTKWRTTCHREIEKLKERRRERHTYKLHIH